MEKKFPIFKILTLLVMLVLGMGTAFAAWDGSIATTAPGTEKLADGKDYYKIENEAQLAWFAAQVNSSTNSNANPHSNINAILKADMDMSGHLWTPIAAGKGDTRFKGIFDGNGHKIIGLYIHGEELAAIHNNEYCNVPRNNKPAVPGCNAQNLGFVGSLDGTVRNLILEDVDIHATTNAGEILSSTDQQISVGAVVGWLTEAGGKVDNCIVSGTIKTTGNSQGVGGIVGNAKKGTISNCMSLVEIRTSGSKADIGGIIGITKTDVSISSCVYAGPGLYNTGTGGSVGGIAGNVWSGTMSAEDSYYEGTNYYQGNEVGGLGKVCGDKCTVHAESVEHADDANSEEVICALNGIESTTGACKTEPWSMGETGPSLSGYGIDGYKIVFNANGGAFANGKANKDKFLNSGMAITADEVGTPSRNNYKFAGWAMTRDATAPAADLGTVSKTDTIFAVWAPVYIVTFNVAPGVFPETNESEKTKQVASGEVITVEGLGTLPTSRCKVYVSGSDDECETFSYFTGWALTEGALEKDSVSLDTVTASDELVLYAVWTDVETYTVTYNANQHGRTTVDYVRVGAGDTVTAPTDPIADSGYEFAGWFTDAEGENPYQFAAQIHESIVLYAKWALDTFTVAYEMNGVSNAGENPVFYTIETPTFALAAPADVEGYVFDGWFYDANFTNPASQVIQGTTGDKTFYAKWSKKTYKVMYLADNNSYGSISDQFVEHGSSITLESAGIFRRAGYEQNGWSTTMGGSKEYELGESITVVAPVTLYPSWSDPIVYTITYVCDGCTDNTGNKTSYTVETPTFSVTFKKITPPEGYKMAGWYSATDYKTKVEQIKKGSFGDMTLYAKLNKIYKITYVGTDKPYCDTLYTVDDAITLRNPADSAGYTFGGWFDNANFEGDAVTQVPQGSTGDKIFYAKWNKVYPFVAHYGPAITVTEYEDGTKTAVVNGDYGDKDKNEHGLAVEILNDIPVNSVVMTREFPTGLVEYSTFVLPFDVSSANVSNVRAVLRYNGIKSGSTISMKVVWAADGVIQDAKGNNVHYGDSTLKANTPYLVLMDQNSDGEFVVNGGVTLKKTTVAETTADGWTFRGTWQYKMWGAKGTDPETGNAYGFSASKSTANNIDVGTFVKVGEGAWIRPMRAYLVKEGISQIRANGAYVKRPTVKPEELPEIMSVVIDGIGDGNETTVIGQFNTRTGVFKMNYDRGKFDLKGRRVNGSNNARGAYYGKKILKK